jgi:hypothetical protein
METLLQLETFVHRPCTFPPQVRESTSLPNPIIQLIIVH